MSLRDCLHQNRNNFHLVSKWWTQSLQSTSIRSLGTSKYQNINNPSGVEPNLKYIHTSTVPQRTMRGTSGIHPIWRQIFLWQVQASSSNYSMKHPFIRSLEIAGTLVVSDHSPRLPIREYVDPCTFIQKDFSELNAHSHLIRTYEIEG